MKLITERSKDMKWREFERHCEELVARCFRDHEYIVKAQREGIYSDQRKRVDIYIAEHRRGGKRYVIDCKHFRKVPLNKNEIITTLEYKRHMRASKAIVLISAVTMCPKSVFEYAEEKGIPILEVSAVNSELVNWVKNFFFKKKFLKSILS